MSVDPIRANLAGPEALGQSGLGSSQGAGALGGSRNRPTGVVNQTAQTFEQALQSLSQQQASSDQLLQKLAAGEDVELHQVMIAAEETDINFRVAMAIRDRLVEAYREVTRMAV